MPPCSRVQQMTIGCPLPVVLADGEGVPSTKFITLTGIWRKRTHVLRVVSMSFPSDAGAFPEIFGITPHEWEIQRPPGQTEKRYPNQFFLEEKLPEGDF